MGTAQEFSLLRQRGVREGVAFLLGAIGVYFAAALASYSPTDPGWSVDGSTFAVHNAFGRFGAVSADWLLGFRPSAVSELLDKSASPILDDLKVGDHPCLRLAQLVERQV